MIRVAINGFGRIGRMVLRAGINHPHIEFVAVNDLTDKKTLVNLFKYDSVHGTFSGTVKETDRGIEIDGKEILVLSEREPEHLPWKQYMIDVVIESTGFFREKILLEKHLVAGAKKVILSAPAKGSGVKTLVLGVNEHTYDPKIDHIISNASCTTNCLAPVVKVLDDNFGIVKGFMTTIHGYTGDQKLVDGPHKDLRRSRAAAINTVPTSTGAAIAVGLVLPHLAGSLDGLAIRVPVPDGSVVDLVCELKKEATKEEINELMKNVSNHHLKGILEYTEDPIVSTDVINNPHSSIFDSSLTFANGNMIKLVSWYDNEYGYACRLAEFAEYIGRKIQ